jgi:GNAT superfamily N-acetyltransferase
VEFRVLEIAADEIDRLREPALALHRHEIAVQPTLGSAPARADEPYWEFYRSRFSDWMGSSDGFCLVAEGVDGEVLGFVFCVEREGFAAYESSAAIGYVEEIAVVDSARRLGVGRAQMDKARERFRGRGYSHFELSTVPGNEDARAFYTSLGMEPAASLLLGDV